MKTAEPKVEIFNQTHQALETLVFTKSSRLKPGTTFEDVLKMPESELLDHLSYMMDTIKTSFEFVDYIFKITNVSRAFTHQLVRTRTASYQQQAMRVVDARDFTCLKTNNSQTYERAIDHSLEAYGEMIDAGIPVQDARGVLPTGIHTEICVKANLRTLSDMAELRLCKRAEGEYQKVFKLMVDEVLKIHPWAEPLLKVYCAKTALCAFPRYDKCPVQSWCINTAAKYQKPLIEKAWKETQHVANPIADDKGMTM